MVSRSITKVKYRPIAIATAELYWLKILLKELQINLTAAPFCLWHESLGAIALASNPILHARTKLIEVEYHYIRGNVPRIF